MEADCIRTAVKAGHRIALAPYPFRIVRSRAIQGAIKKQLTRTPDFNDDWRMTRYREFTDTRSNLPSHILIKVRKQQLPFLPRYKLKIADCVHNHLSNFSQTQGRVEGCFAKLLLVPRLQGTAALQGQERLWSLDLEGVRSSAPRQRRMLLIARSSTSSPRPFSTALSAHRLNPIVCSIFIVGGIESSIRFTTTSTRAGPLC